MVTFSERLYIAEMFSEYVDNINKKNRLRVEKDPLTFMSWLESNGLLNPERCKTFISSDKMAKCFSGQKDCT